MSQKTQMIQMLTDAGAAGVTSRQFNDAQIFRYSARIEELRKAGHEISTERVKGTLFRFILRANNSSSLDARGTAYGNALQEPEQVGGEFTSSPASSLPDRSEVAGEANSTIQVDVHRSPLKVASGLETPAISDRSCLNPYEYEDQAA